MPAQKPCQGGKGRPGCGQSVVIAQAGTGWAVLAPYPELPGHQSAQAVRVGLVRQPGGRTSLTLLAKGDPGWAAGKWYERHRCVTAKTAVARPDRRPQQLALEVDARPADPGRL